MPKFEVEMSDKTAGPDMKTTKEVDSASPDQAFNKAKVGDPSVAMADEVTIRKSDNTMKPPTMENFDSTQYSFPYSLMLPREFKTFVDNVLGKRSKTLVEQKYGSVYITIKDANEMKVFMERLVSTYNKSKKMSSVVIKGILESVSR